jgi:hypothetical protein
MTFDELPPKGCPTRWHRIGFCLLSFAAALPGCTRDRPPRLVPVKGRVTYRNRPVPLATVTFVPDVARGNTRGRDGRASTGKDGSFTMQTYPWGAGVMPGAYRVTVMYYSRTDQLPRKYTKFHLTPLAVEVPEEGVRDLVLTIRD